MKDEALKLALEALLINCGGNTEGVGKEAITAIKQALAAPVPDWDAWNLISRLNRALESIGDYAHDKSTGPAVPDALWEIRSMAYDAIEDTTQPAQPAPVQPVAWRVKVETKLRNGLVDVGYQLRNEKLSAYDEPLYTTQPAAPVQELQRYSPDGEGGMEVDSLGAYVKHQDVTTPPAGEKQ